MLSVETTKYIQMMHTFGNWLSVVPVKLELNGVANAAKVELIFQSKLGRLYMIIQVLFRLLTTILFIKLLMMFKNTMGPADVIVLALIILLGVLTVSMSCICLVWAEEMKDLMTKFFGINQYLRKPYSIHQYIVHSYTY